MILLSYNSSFLYKDSLLWFTYWMTSFQNCFRFQQILNHKWIYFCGRWERRKRQKKQLLSVQYHLYLQSTNLHCRLVFYILIYNLWCGHFGYNNKWTCTSSMKIFSGFVSCICLNFLQFYQGFLDLDFIRLVYLLPNKKRDHSSNWSDAWICQPSAFKLTCMERSDNISIKQSCSLVSLL